MIFLRTFKVELYYVVLDKAIYIRLADKYSFVSIKRPVLLNDL